MKARLLRTWSFGGVAIAGIVSISCHPPPRGLDKDQTELRVASGSDLIAIGEEPIVECFFCGCDACSHFVSSLKGPNLESARIYFAGSLGDANRFAQLHGLRSKVMPDAVGNVARSRGIVHCPAVVIRSSRLSMLIGNGKSVSATEIETVSRILGSPK